MKIVEYPDREFLAMKVADVLASELASGLRTHDTLSLAVPGGSTPGPIFDLLKAADLEWSQIRVMLTDERWVPEDDPRSNTALVKSRLLQGAAAEARFMPFYRDGMSAPEGAAAVAPTLAGLMPLSVLVLGMGDDMHTASLFPGAQGVAEAFAPDAPLLCPVSVAGQDMSRVTLPAHALRGALSTHLVITGDAKRTALERALRLPPEEAPIAAVLGGGTAHWAP